MLQFSLLFQPKQPEPETRKANSPFSLHISSCFCHTRCGQLLTELDPRIEKPNSPSSQPENEPTSAGPWEQLHTGTLSSLSCWFINQLSMWTHKQKNANITIYYIILHTGSISAVQL